MIIRGIFKILGFAFGKLGFWASAVFAAGYGACCLWAGWTFNTYWFLAGLLASWVLGLTVTLAVKRRRYKPAVKPAPVEAAPKERSFSAVKDAAADVTHKKVERPAVTLSDEERAAFDRKYSVEKRAPSETEKLFQTEKERLWKSLETKSIESAPMVFATRKDPNIYIYEYPDRLQFYRKLGDEMVLLSTEYKEEKELKRE